MESREHDRHLESIADRVGVKAAFGEAQKIGDKTVIPVAQVIFGYGYGSGPTVSPVEGATPGRRVSASGSGGGAGGRVKPLGAIIVTPDKVEFQPTVDTVALATAGMALAAWNVFWITRAMRTWLDRQRRK